MATSLVAITNDLQRFNESSWIITAYLLTYTGFLIIWAKLSDIFGRKLVLLTSICLFIVFSAACGLAQSMTELIVFRAFQGMGASGTYSVAVVIFFELIPPEKYATYTSIVSAVQAIGLTLGPLLGGVINNSTTWRWVFYSNTLAGFVAALLLLVNIPKNFPHHGLSRSVYTPLTLRQCFSQKQTRRVDFLGTALLLSASILLVVVLEETGIHFEWRSAFAIAVLIVSCLSWLGFLVWSWKVTRTEGVREPVFPWRFMQSRVFMGILVSVFLTGAPFTVALIQIPIQAQVVYGKSPLDAGIRLLPFAILVAIGAILSATLAGKIKIPPIYIYVCGSAIQIVGFALLSYSPIRTIEGKAQYGYHAVAGFSIGVNLACLSLMAPFAIEKRDKAVAMSAVLQCRTMGGAIGLAIVTTVLNSYLKSHMSRVLSPEEINALLKTTQAFTALPPYKAETVKTVFASGYNLQMRVMVGFSAAQMPLALLMWQKKQIVV